MSGRTLMSLLIAISLLMVSCAPAAEEDAATDTTQEIGVDSTEATEETTSTSSSDPATDDEPVTLVLWSWQDAYAEEWAAIFDVFEEQHPSIEIEFRGISGTEYDTVLRTGLSSADGPDVAFLRAYGLLQPVVAGGNVVAVDGLVDGLDSLPDAVLDGARSVEDDRIYGVPFALQTLQLFSNDDVMAEHGLSQPSTWGELLESCDTLRDAGVAPIAAGVSSAWILPAYLTVFGATSYGGSAFTDEVRSGATNFTDPRYVSAIGNLDQVAARCFPEGAEGLSAGDAKTLFLSGEAAMHVAGSWDIIDIAAAGFPVSVFPSPATPDASDDVRLTPGYVDGSIGINAESPHQDEAVQLLEWLTTPEFGNLLMDELIQPSVVPGTTTNHPLLQQAIDYYGEHPTSWIEYSDFSYGSPDAWTLSQENLQAMLLDQQAPEDVAEAVDRGVSQWLEPSG